MKKLLLCISLLAISRFIEAAAGEPKPLLYIVWKMGISGKVTMPDTRKQSHCFPYVSNGGASLWTFCPQSGDSSPLFLHFDKNSDCRDEDSLMLEKRKALCPRSGEPTIVSVELPKTYAAWDRLPYGTKIFLRYSRSRKVAASLQFPATPLQVGVTRPEQVAAATLQDDGE